jgi:hypothetical protein
MEQNDNPRPEQPQQQTVISPDTYHEDAFGLNYAVYDDTSLPEFKIPAEPISDVTSLADLKDMSSDHLIVLGFVIAVALMSVVNVIFWILLAARPDYGVIYRILGPILAVGEFVLASRTLNRSEAARAICLFSTIVLLLFSVFGSYNFIENYHNRNQLQQNIIAQTEQTINTYKSDKLITASEQFAITTELKATETSDLNKLSKKNSFLPLTTIYVLTFLPVIFLERPAVKKLFK